MGVYPSPISMGKPLPPHSFLVALMSLTEYAGAISLSTLWDQPIRANNCIVHDTRYNELLRYSCTSSSTTTNMVCHVSMDCNLCHDGYASATHNLRVLDFLVHDLRDDDSSRTPPSFLYSCSHNRGIHPHAYKSHVPYGHALPQ